jgi:hypothetical protein
MLVRWSLSIGVGSALGKETALGMLFKLQVPYELFDWFYLCDEVSAPNQTDEDRHLASIHSNRLVVESVFFRLAPIKGDTMDQVSIFF